MTDRYSEDEVITIVTRLTRTRLVGFIDGNFVRPERAEGGYVFRRIDIARLELLCDLSDDMDLDEGSIDLVLSLVDQLHAARQQIAVLSRAFDSLPAAERDRVIALLKDI